MKKVLAFCLCSLMLLGMPLVAGDLETFQAERDTAVQQFQQHQVAIQQLTIKIAQLDALIAYLQKTAKKKKAKEEE